MTRQLQSRIAAGALSGLFALQAVAVVAQTSASATPPAAVAVTETPQYKRGRLLFIQCRACHEVKAAQPAKVGPSLHGLIGAKSGQVAGFTYSAALRNANLTWDQPTLDRWLERPGAVVPGNSMAFAGVANPKDRAALLTYLEVETR